MKKMKVVTMMLVGASLAISAAAAAGPRGGLDAPRPEQRERVRRKIETLKMWRLTQALELSEGDAAKLFPLLARHERERAGIEEAVGEEVRSLRQALQRGEKKGLAATIDRIEELHRELQALRDRQFGELREALSVEQQARLLIFQLDFGEEMRRLIGEVRDRRRPGDGSRRDERRREKF